MKTKISALKFAILFSGIVCMNCTHILGQVQKDPLKGIYKYGGASELFISFTNPAETQSANGIMEIPEDLSALTSDRVLNNREYLDHFRSASAVGDFDGDGADDVVTITNNTTEGIKITIPIIGKNLEVSGYKEYYDTTLNISGYERLRICSGNFDDDPPYEFALCYGKSGENLNISIFETDAELNITLLDSYGDIPYFSKLFDIGSGDTDGDGFDELVMVNNVLTYIKDASLSPPIFMSDYGLHILDYNVSTNAIEPSIIDRIIRENQAPDYYYDKDHGVKINDIRISCGNMDEDYNEEIAVAWTNYYSHWGNNGQWFRSLVFLQTFEQQEVGNNIKDVFENEYVTLNTFSQLYPDPSHHMALGLQCVNMDNVGTDEIIIATGQHLNLYSCAPGMLIQEDDIFFSNPDYDHIDMKGNETFAVADLNPDTASLDFYKEVILLRSDLRGVDQLQNDPSITTLEIYEFSKPGPNDMSLTRIVPAHAIPFDFTENVIITSFVAGDFDLAKSSVYFIGEPDVIPVSDLEQPIVILNAPPVHFDVLNGETHDICNAFGVDNPPFYASYKTEIENQTTTRVAVKKAYSYSRDLSAYAMAGGTGFEASVEKNYNVGNSYYTSNTQQGSIQETKNAYTEDYVLFSRMDYRYYGYPVYNSDGEKVGDICVLNPESDQLITSWGSGNSWVNPGYIFNHEPGNILSYKNYIDSVDFTTKTNLDFTPYTFAEVPVSHTGDGSFRFTFEKISSQGDSLSYSYGTGRDIFAKIGMEGSVGLQINLGIVQFGGSSDVRAGVSADLSRNYSNTGLETHRTTLENTFQVDGVIGRLEAGYDNIARYSITPYVYLSQSGAIVLDYKIDIDDNNADWWMENYGQKPDLALILPWRYATEKGGLNVKLSKKQKTNDIQFFNPVVSPEDTVCITTRVHNYSLKEFNDSLRIKLYLGDPEKGGILLEDIYGNTEISKDVIMIFEESEEDLDNEEYFTFNWKVPDTVTCSPRIYAVIDPGNEIEEIHKNNNVGWNRLPLMGCEDCIYPEQISGIQNQPDNINLFDLNVYPNPAKSKCTIEFFLPYGESANIGLFNMSGALIQNIANDFCSEGRNAITFDTGHLNSGVYLIKVTASNANSINKLVISAR